MRPQGAFPYETAVETKSLFADDGFHLPI